MQASPFDIVTVFYRREIDLVLLQLRSLAKFLPTEMVNSVILVWNDEWLSGEAEAELMEMLETHAGRFAAKVRLLHRNHVGTNETLLASEYGWRTQQALKLQTALTVQAEFYCVLDAKNHFVAPCSYGDFFSDDGKPITTFTDWATRRARRVRQTRAGLTYFGLHPSPDDRLIGLPTVTPMVMYTGLVKNLIHEVESREEIDFTTAFLTNKTLSQTTEFLLYSAYLKAHRGLDAFYIKGHPIFSTFFTTHPDTDKARNREMARILSGEAKIMGVHSKREARLIQPERDFFTDVWLDRGLISSREEASLILEPR